VFFIFHEIAENKVYPVITGNFQAPSSSAAGMYLEPIQSKKQLGQSASFVLVGIMFICDYSKDP
jgi:hypothetical protein